MLHLERCFRIHFNECIISASSCSSSYDDSGTETSGEISTYTWTCMHYATPIVTSLATGNLWKHCKAYRIAICRFIFPPVDGRRCHAWMCVPLFNIFNSCTRNTRVTKFYEHQIWWASSMVEEEPLGSKVTGIMKKGLICWLLYSSICFGWNWGQFRRKK